MPVPKPTFKEEQIFWDIGHRHVAGADEAGRGCWAGPIVAGAVILPVGFEPKKVRDSKTLSPKQREAMFVYITTNAVAWAVGVVSSEDIDRHGISPANKLAIALALRKLHIQPDAVLIDAVKIECGDKPVKAVIDGDATILSIAAASIVAKVVRDSLMQGEHRLYPEYGFAGHKGYGTKEHASAIHKHGLTPIHRRSFQPMKSLVSLNV